MQSSLIAHILFVLSLMGFVAAASEPPVAKLEVRQTQVTPTIDQRCTEYDWTANMSTIGSNGTYRTVLLQKSNVGTIYNARMMDAAILKLPAMTADQELNRVCGNFTERALAQAEKNFTEGVVAQFTTEGLPVGIKSGTEVLYVVGAVSLVFSLVWVFSG